MKNGTGDPSVISLQSRKRRNSLCTRYYKIYFEKLLYNMFAFSIPGVFKLQRISLFRFVYKRFYDKQKRTNNHLLS